jgi:hypothetical protein
VNVGCMRRPRNACIVGAMGAHMTLAHEHKHSLYAMLAMYPHRVKLLTVRNPKMSALVHYSSTHKVRRRAVRVRRARLHRPLRSALDRDAPSVLMPQRPFSQAQRISIYNQAVAKLNVKPNASLETQWGDLPPELVEMVAAHLHPEDVARLRSVSSGWRAALWQERVVRASLRGLGPRVNELLLFKIVSASGHGRKAVINLCDNFWAKDRSSLTIAWEPVLDRMNERLGAWDAYIKMNTGSTVVRVWLSTMPPLSPLLHAEERAKKRAVEMHTLTELERKGRVALC